MNKNLLKIYESFLDDLDKLNPNQYDGFRGTNDQVYNEHNYILSRDKNPEFFYGLCDMCEYYQIPYNKNGFLQEDLDKITFIKSDNDWISFFQDIISLDELQYFHNLEIIEIYSFKSCKELKSIILPKSLQEINSNAFNKCISLKEIIFPENIKFIGPGSFLDCENLEKIIIPENIKKISNGAFYDCSSLKKIIIPERFKNNMKYIFYEVNLTKVDIIYI